MTSGAEIEATDEEGWAPQISACAVQNGTVWNTLSPNLEEECSRHALATAKDEPAEPDVNLEQPYKLHEANCCSFVGPKIPAAVKALSLKRAELPIACKQHPRVFEFHSLCR